MNCEDCKYKPKRTTSQNNSLHLWLTQIASELNSQGQTYTNPLDIETKYTMTLLKEVYWKPTLKEVFGIESTTQMTSSILNNMIDSFNIWLSNYGIYIPFPNLQEYLNKLDAKNE
jgi:hypothetical protein